MIQHAMNLSDSQEDFQESNGVSSAVYKSSKRFMQSGRATIKNKGNSLLLYFIATFCLLLLMVPTQVGAFNCLYTTNPQHYRLALLPTGMTVSWTSDGYLRDDGTPTLKVLYGTDPANLNNVSTSGFTTTYYPVVGYRKFFHNVFLNNLQPETVYYYQIPASTRCVTESDVMSFTSAPFPGGDPNLPVQITIVGDIGMNTLFNITGGLAAIRYLQNYIASTDFLLNVGDLGYADSSLSGSVNYNFTETVWNNFQSAITPFASAVPYQTCAGNHEVTCYINGDTLCPEYMRNFTIYNSRFCMAGDLSGGFRNLWYSFDYGPVHVVVLNTETDFPDAPSGPGTTLNGGGFVGIQSQISWLTADLQKATAPAQRAKIPWLIAMGHRAFFGSLFKVSPTAAAPSTAGQYCQPCKNAFWPLFTQYNVDFYMTGHVHWAELLYPMDVNGNVVARNFTSGQGVIHITDGAAGAPPANNQLYTQDTIRSVWVYSGIAFHRLIIQNSTHATLEFIDAMKKIVFYSTLVVRSR